MHKLAHSFSALELFDNCPLRYYKQRVSKEVKDEGGEASKYGDRVHKAFEDRLKDKTPLPSYLAVHEPTCAALEAMGGTLIAENEMVLTKELAPTGWWDENAWLRSKLDVDIDLGSKTVTLDWKSGKRRPKFLQLELAALQIFLHRPATKKVSAGFVWLQDRDIDSEVYKREDYGSILSKLQAKTKRIEDALEEGVWPAKPGPLCNYCPAKDTCLYADTKRRR